MDYLLAAFVALIAIAVGVAFILSWQSRKRRQEAAAEARKASEAWDKAKAVERVPTSVGPFIRTSRSADYRRRASYSGTAQAPAPVQQSSGMDPLVAGVIGYAIGSSLHSNEAHAAPVERFESCKPDYIGGGGDSGGGGSSSSYESDSSSSSSDSSSSDSGSSDSGGSSGGGSD